MSATICDFLCIHDASYVFLSFFLLFSCFPVFCFLFSCFISHCFRKILLILFLIVTEKVLSYITWYPALSENVLLLFLYCNLYIMYHEYFLYLQFWYNWWWVFDGNLFWNTHFRNHLQINVFTFKMNILRIKIFFNLCKHYFWKKS